MNVKTYRLRKADFDRKWRVLDAADRPLGRLASEAAKLLLGKHKPDYEPHLPMGDYVVVVNAERVRLTGDKAQNKVYYRHSGYPGGLRERTVAEQLQRNPRRVIELAVRGMLPHNSLGRELFRHLNVYAGPDHPHTAQVMEGTGARARRRAAREEATATAEVAAAPVAVEAADVDAPAVEEAVAEPPAAEAPEAIEEAGAAGAPPAEPLKALSRMTRTELDEEAESLGIDIDPDWKKTDVQAAVREARERFGTQEQGG